MPDSGVRNLSLRLNFPMVSVKWGDFLSMLLPGVVALWGIGPCYPGLSEHLNNLDRVGIAGGIALLIAAALMGGILEAFTRITWEKFVLVRACKPANVLSRLTPDNISLYERGVQSSYKWCTFYANFAWATAILFAGRTHAGAAFLSIGSGLLLLAIAVLLIASYVQWTYYVSYNKKVFRVEVSKNAERRPASGNES